MPSNHTSLQCILQNLPVKVLFIGKKSNPFCKEQLRCLAIFSMLHEDIRKSKNNRVETGNKNIGSGVTPTFTRCEFCCKIKRYLRYFREKNRNIPLNHASLNLAKLIWETNFTGTKFRFERGLVCNANASMDNRKSGANTEQRCLFLH